MCRLAAERHPSTVRWKLILHTTTAFGSRVIVREGARKHSGEPNVWVLTGDDPFYDGQALALARTLGWAYTEKPLRFGAMGRLPNKLLGATVRALRPGSRSELTQPWPDLVIASGRRSVPVARWIGQRSRGASRLVLVGDEGAESAEGFDVLVSPGHARLWPHPHRIETLVPLPMFTEADLVEAARRAPDRFAGFTHPWILLLATGGDDNQGLDVETARRLGEQVGSFAAGLGGSVVALADHGPKDEVGQALGNGLGAQGILRPGSPGTPDDRLAHLAQADMVVVTDQSVAVLGVAFAAGKPVYICTLPIGAPARAHPIRGWIQAQALSRPANRRGTTRPQQGLEYFCARLIAGGYVRPTPRPETTFETLIERGYALPCVQSPAADGPQTLDQMGLVVERLKSLLANPRVI
jgi:mitochondrial fission protein ELM1